MKTVALVSCSKEKRKPEEGCMLQARELYGASDFFRAQFAEAEARCSEVYVVSAEYRLVRPEQPLPYYDMTMAEVVDKAAWGRGVVGALEAIYPGEVLKLVVFAGADYVGPIEQAMPYGWVLEEPLAGQTLPERRHSLKIWRELREQATGWLVLPALAIQQPGGTVYAFGVDGKRVPEFAGVDRIRRREGVLQGYQRVEAGAHVVTIREYMQSAKPLLPNAVVFSFDERVRFDATPGATFGHVRTGLLSIPLGTGEDWKPPGWIVDGQQRLAAVRGAEVEGFTIPACAFIGTEAEQAEHFIRVNSTKPLPKDLIYSLLPGTGAKLSPALEARKLPALLVERLNEEDGSPLKGVIQTMTNPGGRAKSTSFLGALEDSLRDGALYHLRESEEAMVSLLWSWWGAVMDTFPADWEKKPKESRLFHGAGVAALFLLMDTVAELLPREPTPTRGHFAKELGRVAADCRWSSGEWGHGPAWNQVQNTAQDKHRLAMFLARRYWERSKPEQSKRGRR